jgi:endonuclease/exonuclease/phosphatase family metal-dependent hydrolase
MLFAKGRRIVSLGAASCVLLPALMGCGQSSTYTLMQMNLCLSGLASCYGKVAYPAVVHEAITRIRELHPDAVTFNEACGSDAASIARQTGYHLRFSRVIYRGRPLPCIRPSGRGLFGDAVLTKAAIESADSRPFDAQAGFERREWICVSTRVKVEVCTAHLASDELDEVAANDPQCFELRALLARRAAASTVIFAGDLNRRSSCAPNGFWIRTDSSARQNPGLQQVYGTRALRSPSAEVLPATHTDHDVLLARTLYP